MVVRPCGEAEIGAAVEHIQVEARPRVEKGIELSDDASRASCVVSAAETVKPPAPEFSAHQRDVPALQNLEVACRVAAEIHCRQRTLRASSALHIRAAPVRGEHHDLHARVRHELSQSGEIFLVVAVGAVFVLDLHGDDGSALGALQVAYLLHDARDIPPDMPEVDGVQAPDAHILVGKQPRRQSAEIPFRADVRTGTENDIEPELARRLHKAPDIQPAREVELTLARLVEIPAHICFDGV